MVRHKESKYALTHISAIFLWLFAFINGLHAVKIVKVVVPEIIQYGVEDAVVLDCEYTYGNDTAGLMVKWFFKNKARPVYQWIASQKPQDMGILRGRVDLTYKASNDPLKMHRALRIVKPNTDISGDYTCVVSTFMEEDSKTKQMIVFAPETNFRLVQNKTDDDTVNVICAADGAFPAPNLTLATPERRLSLPCGVGTYYTTSNRSRSETLTSCPCDQPLRPTAMIWDGLWHCNDDTHGWLRHLDGVSHHLKLVNGRYSAVATVTLLDADLPAAAEFICTLRIPQAKYAVRKEAIYYPGPISTTPEMPTAADMQLAAAVGSRGSCVHTALTILMLPAIAQLYLS